MYLNICEKSLTSVFIFCYKENWEKVPFFKVLDKETLLRRLFMLEHIEAPFPKCRPLKMHSLHLTRASPDPRSERFRLKRRFRSNQARIHLD